jgi:hypothetical protein
LHRLIEALRDAVVSVGADDAPESEEVDDLAGVDVPRDPEPL